MSNLKSTVLIAIVGVGLGAGWARAGGPGDADADKESLVAGNSRFALEMYAHLRQQDGNLFFSPLSLSTALAMTYAGARGDTAREMAEVLHFDVPAERLHPAFAGLLSDLDTPEGKPGYRLHIANALWVEQTHKFLPEFLAIGRTHYRAGLEAVDFARAFEQARREINAWVAERTEQKIKDLIPAGVLGPATRLVLTNAIYFKGDWAAKFDKKHTRDGPFTLTNGKRVQVPLMHQTGQFGYLEQPDFQVLELPYAGEALSMVVLLPRKHDGLAELERSLDAKTLSGWLRRLHPREVRVTLPRFTTTSQFGLNDVLKAMGMRAAFDPGAADFSGMDGSKWLYIAAVLHKAFVDVNEEGTEAAAATAVVMKVTALPQPPPTFRADHPFLFLIRDTRSGSILFIGRVLNPKS